MTECRGCGCRPCDCPCGGCGGRNCPGGCFWKTDAGKEIERKRQGMEVENIDEQKHDLRSIKRKGNAAEALLKFLEMNNFKLDRLHLTGDGSVRNPLAQAGEFEGEIKVIFQKHVDAAMKESKEYLEAQAK